MSAEAPEAAKQRFLNRRLFVIGAMRLIESMNVTMIMPYGVEMVSNLLYKGTDEADSSEVDTAYAWLIGLYSLFEIVFSPAWGILADMIGRKPCLLMGIVGTAMAQILLALGPSLTAVFLFRALDGFFCGNQALCRTYLGEVVAKEDEARAFSFLVLCFVLGFIVGPFLGGLAFPARWAPQVFVGTIFEDYPILLPNLVFAAIAMIVCILGFIVVEETLPKGKLCIQAQQEAGNDLGESDLGDVESTSSQDSTVSTASKPRKYGYPLHVLQAMLTFCGLAGAVEAFNTLTILLWQYPQHSGGFGFSPQQVSIVQVTGGVGPILCHLMLFQVLTKKLGLVKVLLLGFVINSLAYSLYPVYSLLADERYGFWRYVVLGLAEFVGMSGTYLLFSAAFVFLNRASEGLNRATLNGWANSGRAVCRAISPLYASKLLHVSGACGPALVGTKLPYFPMQAEPPPELQNSRWCGMEAGSKMFYPMQADTQGAARFKQDVLEQLQSIQKQLSETKEHVSELDRLKQGLDKIEDRQRRPRALPPIEALLASTMDTWPEDTEDELLAANIRKGEQVCKRLRRHQSK
eukprot:Skav206829  [mRNA]  locus=scaffold3672:98935:110154:+ [translate_table: standard]